MSVSISPARDALIIGCGYLGVALAHKLIRQGVTVSGTTRGTARASELSESGVQPLILDVTQPLTFAAMRKALESDLLDVYYLIPPGRAWAGELHDDPALRGVANILAALDNAWVHRAVLASSTAVYGQTGGDRVDAETTPQPADDRAKRLLHIERLWLEAGPAYRVVRLAGLYGRDRIVGLGSVRRGHPLVGDPYAMLNLLHVDDAAELLPALARCDRARQVELASDGSPVPRIEYYQDLAKRVGVPPPRLIDDETAALELGLNLDRLRRVSSKRCDPAPTSRRTGWQPRYRHFRDGLDELLPQPV